MIKQRSISSIAYLLLPVPAPTLHSYGPSPRPDGLCKAALHSSRSTAPSHALNILKATIERLQTASCNCHWRWS